MNQDQITQNMKTAEEVLHAKYVEAYDNTKPGQPFPKYPEKYEIEAMKAYAQAAIEADRKDAAEKTADWLYDQGIYGYGVGVKRSILDRPYPEMK